MASIPQSAQFARIFLRPIEADPVAHQEQGNDVFETVFAALKYRYNGLNTSIGDLDAMLILIYSNLNRIFREEISVERKVGYFAQLMALGFELGPVFKGFIDDVIVSLEEVGAINQEVNKPALELAIKLVMEIGSACHEA